MAVLFMQSVVVSAHKSHPTSGCTRLPNARFINHALPANKLLIEGSLAGPAAREPQALGGRAAVTHRNRNPLEGLFNA